MTLDNNQLLYAILLSSIIGDQSITKAKVLAAIEKADKILDYLNALDDA